MPAGGVTVSGLRELQVLFAKAGPEANKALRKDLAEIAEPIRADAAALAASTIPRIGVPWAQMRVGVTRKLVYVAPRKRGVKTGPQKRPNLATLLMNRAMAPALERNKAQIQARVEATFAELSRKWSR